MSWCPDPPDVPEPKPPLLQTVPPDLTRTLCDRVMHPIAIKGAILETLRNQFKQANVAHEVVLRDKVWTPDTGTKIVIESIYRWKMKDVGTRPALLVKSHGVKFQQISIGDLVRYDNNCQSVFSFRVFGTHSIMAIAEGGEAALWLACEAMMAIAEFQPVIRVTLGLSSFRVDGMEGPSSIEEARESFVCPINISWYFDHVWKLNQESPILKDVLLTPDTLLQ